MHNKIHIICLDAPSLPDYGGAIDMYYKIKALAESGAKITLHYFDYKKGRNAEGVKEYCKEIYLYKRKSFLQAPTFSKPHIVASRVNQELIARLNTDDDPILLEGIHCTGIIPHLKNRTRKIVVRLHNDEAVYYQHLAKAEMAFFKSSYYAIESFLLKRYQQTLSPDVSYAAISQTDADTFRNNYRLKNVFLIPAFTPWQQVSSLTGSGTYCLYQGNLSVAENEAAALWLIEKVFSLLNVPLVIAGKNIPQRLIKKATSFQNIRFKTNPADDELSGLIQHAHINVLPNFNNTGIKVKLLHALFCGRFCISHCSEIESSNTIAFAKTAQDYMGFIKSFMAATFTDADIAERKKSLRLYNNKENAQTLNERLS